MYRASGPRKNTGIEIARTAMPIALRSATVCGRSADKIPTEMPTRSHTIAAPIASCAVTAIRLKMMPLSGTLEMNDKPRPGQPY